MKIYKITEASKYLGVSINTLRNLKTGMKMITPADSGEEGEK